jgi:hypothetical protein
MKTFEKHRGSAVPPHVGCGTVYLTLYECCMYVERVGQKSGPCTATFNDLLCFFMNVTASVHNTWHRSQIRQQFCVAIGRTGGKEYCPLSVALLQVLLMQCMENCIQREASFICYLANASQWISVSSV